GPAHAGDVGPLPGEPGALPAPGELPVRGPAGHRPRRHRRPGAVPGRQDPRRGRRGHQHRTIRMVHARPVTSTSAPSAPEQTRDAGQPGRRRRMTAALPTRTALLFIAPAALLFAVFVLYPMATAVSYSMHSWRGTSQGEFIGLANFAQLFTS